MKCRFCEETELKELVSFKDYPIFIGCSDGPLEKDERYDFAVYACPSCGMIQQCDLPPLDILYREQRAFGLGPTWQKHYEAFFDFIAARLDGVQTIMEVGGGNGVMLQKLLVHRPDARFYDVEPYPYYDLNNVTIHKAYFDAAFDPGHTADLIYASHLIEHLGDANPFFAKAAEVLTPHGRLITACPNIEQSFLNLHLNAFTTDHFNYYSPATLQALALKHGLVVTGFFAYKDHGMYLEFRKKAYAEANGLKPLVFDQKTDLLTLFNGYQETVQRFAAQVKKAATGPVYLFGAHAFTITFLRYLEEAPGPKIRAEVVLDNEPSKHGRRLTGTALLCQPPSVLAAAENPTVVIYMGTYTGEICAQLHNINPGVRLLRLDHFAAAASLEKAS